MITSGKADADGWEASVSIPRASLREHLGSGPRIRLNATFIIDSPQQRFLTATDLGSGTPDFHQAERFPLVDLA